MNKKVQMSVPILGDKKSPSRTWLVAHLIHLEGKLADLAVLTIVTFDWITTGEVAGVHGVSCLIFQVDWERTEI